VLITIDTLRADRLGAYGYAKATSPEIDALAERGVLFVNASTNIPRTTQAVATLFTGRYPHEHGVSEIGERLPQEETTLAEILRDAGYQTAAISANRVAGRLQALDQGFQTFVSKLDLQSRYPLTREPEEGQPTAEMGQAEAVTQAALTWLGDHPQGPYFLWLLYFDPHWRYDPPAPFNQVVDWERFDFYRDLEESPPGNATVFFNLDGRSAEALPELSRLYDAEVRYIDAMIGKLLAGIRARSDADDTLIVLTADHGESLGEHGYFYEHGDFVYQPTMHVPLIFHQPGVLPQGARIETLVSNLDVAPTLLSLLSISEPEGAAFAGQDLSDAIRDPPAMPSELSGRIIFGESGSGMLAQNPMRLVGGRRSARNSEIRPPFRYARRGDWLLVTEEGRPHLYNATQDPELTRDLADAFPGIVQSMQSALTSLPFLKARWQMARDARWKLIRIPELDRVRWELYDLEKDPLESQDLSAVQPEVVTRLRKPLELWVRGLSRALPRGGTGLSPEDQAEIDRQLRALGYID
jgi:arylsulfatase A-like enzyme